MIVADFMSSDPMTTTPEANLQTAMQTMLGVGRRLPVVDEAGKLVGMVTDRDLRLAVNSPLVMQERWQNEMLLQQTTVEAVMSSPVVTVNANAGLKTAAELLIEHKISGLAVVDEAEKLVGIITITDMLRALTVLAN